MDYPEVGHVLLVWDRIGDYHAARFWSLKNRLPQAKVFVADLGAADTLYKWKNPVVEDQGYTLLSSKPVDRFDFFGRLFRFWRFVRENNIGTVGIAGYGRAEYIAFILLSAIWGKRVVLFAESWYGSPGLKSRLKGWFLRWTCNGFLVSGARAKSHFEKVLNQDPARIEIGYSVVDNAHFKEDEGIDRAKILLCVARFSPEKNLIRLISAFKKSKLFTNWTLQLVGGGPLKGELETAASGSPQIKLSEWLPYQALPLLYAHARFFILPSSFEPWGLVVNEAMASGLPIALSKQCGCAPDLADERNSFIFDAENEPDLIACLDKIANLSDSEWRQMSQRSMQKIQQFTPDNWALAFVRLALI